MLQQITHEADQNRQHARCAIPLTVYIDGRRYKVRSWSVSGFALHGLIPKKQGEPFKSTLIFNFEQFDSSLTVEAELVWVKDSEQLCGCRFHNLSPHQQSVLRYVMDAYTAGELVSLGDLIQIVRRDNFQAPRKKNEATEKLSGPARLKQGIKKFVGMGLILAALVSLLGFTVNSIYKRLFFVEAQYATVDAPLVVIRAPQPSYFDPLQLTVNQQVRKGEPVASVELIGGGAVAIDSPCDCTLLAYQVMPRAFVATGEPLMTLLPSGRRLYIKAYVDAKDLKKIRLGNSAMVRFPDGNELPARIKRMQSSLSSVQRNASVLDKVSSRPISYSEVLLELTKGKISADMLDAPVSVLINTRKTAANVFTES